MGITSYCRRREGEELKRKKIQERMGIEGKWQRAQDGENEPVDYCRCWPHSRSGFALREKESARLKKKIHSCCGPREESVIDERRQDGG